MGDNTQKGARMDRATTLTLTEQDLRLAGRRHVFSSLTQRQTMIRLGIIWLGAFVVSIGMFLVLGTGKFAFWQASALALAVATIGAIGVPILMPLLALPMAIKRRFRQDAMLRQPLTVTWTDSHYRVETESTTNNLPWRDYARWCEDEAQFLFFLSDYTYQVLPKRVLTPEQVADIRAVVTTARA